MTGDPIAVDGVEITPLFRIREFSVGSRFGGFSGASLRPTAIEVRGHGPVRLMNVPDVLRWIRVAGLVGVVAFIALRRKND